MGIFEQFPYTNMQNANLDWVLRIADELRKALDDDFSGYLAAWVEEHYNELFFNASYTADTETIVLAKTINGG